MKAIIRDVCKLVLFFALWIVLILVFNFDLNDPVLWRFVAELVPALAILGLTYLFVRFDPSKIHIPVFHQTGRALSAGAILGLIWFFVPLGILILIQAIALQGINEVDCLWLWILSAILNVIMQNVLIWGYGYQLLKTNYSRRVAISCSLLLFVLLHGGAIEAGLVPTFNVLTMGLFMVLLYEYYQSILAPITAHAFWNVWGGVIFGCVSLASDYPSLIQSEMNTNMNPLMSGGELGLEGSLIVFILHIILIFYYLNRLKLKESRV